MNYHYKSEETREIREEGDSWDSFTKNLLMNLNNRWWFEFIKVSPFSKDTKEKMQQECTIKNNITQNNYSMVMRILNKKKRLYIIQNSLFSQDTKEKMKSEIEQYFKDWFDRHTEDALKHTLGDKKYNKPIYPSYKLSGNKISVLNEIINNEYIKSEECEMFWHEGWVVTFSFPEMRNGYNWSKGYEWLYFKYFISKDLLFYDDLIQEQIYKDKGYWNSEDVAYLLEKFRDYMRARWVEIDKGIEYVQHLATNPGWCDAWECLKSMYRTRLNNKEFRLAGGNCLSCKKWQFNFLPLNKLASAKHLIYVFPYEYK